MMIPAAALAGFARAWVLTVMLEGLVLWFVLSPAHSARTRLFAAVWLSSCTLPLVHFGFPALRWVGASDVAWVAAAELFAPVAECALFAWVIAPAGSAVKWRGRDLVAIVLANAVSFGSGVVLLG